MTPLLLALAVARAVSPAEPLPPRAVARMGAALPHVHGVATPDGRRQLAVLNGVLRVWDIAAAREVARYGVPTGVPGPNVEYLRLARDGRTAVLFVLQQANDRDSTRSVVLWDVAGNKLRREVAFDWWRPLLGPNDAPPGADAKRPWVSGYQWAVSADGTELVGAGDDLWLVRLTDPPTGRRVAGPLPKVDWSVALAHTGDRVVYASQSGGGAWDLATGKRLWSAGGGRRWDTATGRTVVRVALAVMGRYTH